jgi:hypothetical protein
MVDQPAEAASALGFTRTRARRRRAGPLTGATDWLTSLAAPDAEAWGRPLFVPVVVTGVWLMALGAYAVGYFERLSADAAAGATRALPTLDLLFFAFAAAGPVLMLWMVVLLQTRAARLSEALNAQSESALALAATVAGLYEAVESLRESTTARIADAAAAVERDGAAAMAQLDAALAEMVQRLDTGMMDAVAVLDRQLRERTARADASLEVQRDALARRLDEDAERLARAIEAQARGLEAAQAMLGERIEQSLVAHGNRFERGTTELLETLAAQLDEIGDSVNAAMSRLAADLASAQRNRHRDLDADMRKREVRLHDAVEEVARAIEGGVAPLLGDIRVALAETRQAIAVSPPATSGELGRLLGDAAKQEIAPERAALTEAVGRLAAIEGQARELIERIDRTARLNPYMDTSAATRPFESAPPELPFSALPRGATRTTLDWTAVVHALGGRRVGEGARRIVEKAAADPDVAAVAELTQRVAAALAEDGLHLADIAPMHATAEPWHRFGMGERGEAVELLGAVEDDIAPAIARARLRDDPAFRDIALRLVVAYARLLARAAAEIGPDPRLVELADTPSGRAFVLLAGPTRALSAVPGAEPG